jgi:hypothetical protein
MTTRQQRRALEREQDKNLLRVESPPVHPSGHPRLTRREYRWGLNPAGNPAPRATTRATRHPMWGRWAGPLGRLSPASLGRSPAAEARRNRKTAQRREHPRVTRRQRLALMRTGDPYASRADVTALLRSQAHARRAGLL